MTRLLSFFFFFFLGRSASAGNILIVKTGHSYYELLAYELLAYELLPPFTH